MVESTDPVPVVASPYRVATTHDVDRIVADLGAYNPAEFSFSQGGALGAQHKRRHVLGTVHMQKCCVLSRDVLLRGDIAPIRLGRFVLLGEAAVVRPTLLMGKAVEPAPVRVGDYVVVGARSVVEAVSVGSSIVIEGDCIIGARSVVSDGVWLQANAVVPPGTTLAPFCVYAGNPATIVGQVHPETGLFELRDAVLDIIRGTGLFDQA